MQRRRYDLRRRGYEVCIGQNETKELDFVAVRRDERIYVQVCRRLLEELDREVANLLEISGQGVLKRGTMVKKLQNSTI